MHETCRFPEKASLPMPCRPLTRIAMYRKAACLCDEELDNITGSNYISLEEFITMNGLDPVKIMNDPKYHKTVMLAYGLANYTAGMTDAGSGKSL
jgi:hypothetical protein